MSPVQAADQDHGRAAAAGAVPAASSPGAARRTTVPARDRGVRRSPRHRSAVRRASHVDSRQQVSDGRGLRRPVIRGGDGNRCGPAAPFRGRVSAPRRVMTWNSGPCEDSDELVPVPSPPKCWACGIGARHTLSSCVAFRRASAVEAFNCLPAEARHLLLTTARETVESRWTGLTGSQRTDAAIDVWLAASAAERPIRPPGSP